MHSESASMRQPIVPLVSPKSALGQFRAQLNESLFPSAPVRQRRLGRAGATAVLLTLVALAIALQLLRVGPKEALDALWAEDGQIFLQGALTGGLHALFHTYAGYLVLVPRLIGEVGALVPLRYAPAAIAVVSSVVVALSGLAVWLSSAAFIRDPYLRGTLAAVTVLVPVAGLESVASGTYVPWFMLVATFWLLLWRPPTTRGAFFAGLFILCTGLSTPSVWFFAPLALLRALAARDRRDFLILGSFAIGAIVQIPVIAANTELSVTPVWTNNIWTAYMQRVLDGTAFGERLGGVAWAHLGWPFLIALGVCAAAALAIGLRHSLARSRWLAAIAIPTSLVMFVVSTYQRGVGTAMMWPAGTHFGDGGRYAIVPALLLVSAALSLTDTDALPREQKRTRRPWPALAAAGLLLLGLTTSFDVSEPKSRGEPPWGEALGVARASCRSQHLLEVRVPTSPPNFGMTVPCDSLQADGDPPVGR